MVKDPREIEEQIIDFWKNTDAYKNLKKRNKGGKPFYYLDGPPYTSGAIHIGTAWGKAMRDSVMRYKRMQGFDVFDRAGFDMHGLPTQHKVEAKFGLHGKKDIESFGPAKFTEESKKLALENMQKMIADFRRLGVWMDFDEPYMPITTEYIEGVWWLIKTAYEKGRLYESYRTLHWDSKDETALSKHELEYKKLRDDSIFVKFKVKDKENEFLLVWTTTPWTIPFNLGVMVNPEVEYSRVNTGKNYLWIASPLVDSVMKKAGVSEYSVDLKKKGMELEGLKYEHPLKDKIPKYAELEKKSKNVHTILLSREYVETSSGSGLVHCAPGCGPEDYEVGYQYGLAPFNTVDERGTVQDLGEMSGWRAKKDDKKFVEEIEKSDALFLKESYVHDYPHAERSKEPVVFRVTKQWFLKIEDIKPKMKELNAGVKWVPEWAGRNQFHNWIDQLRDNSITKQIHWGTPLPIWRAEDGSIIVIGSVSELKEYAATSIPDDLHKPYIDSVVLKKEGKEYKRIPDVLDVWVDAGSASWLSLDYPKRKDLFERFFPADFITEGKDQIRGWFNLLLVASVIGFDDISFRACYMTGFINDALGRKMSKSLGNVISPYEVIEKYGADNLRYYIVGGANPGEDLNYNFEDIDVKKKNLTVLFNLIELLKGYCSDEGITQIENLTSADFESADNISKAMISLTQKTIRNVTEMFDSFRINEITWEIERMFLDLSRNYIQFVREDMSQGSENKTGLIAKVIGSSLKATVLLFAPIIPHLTEYMHSELKELLGFKEESVHHEKWPEYDDKMIREDLAGSFSTVLDIRAALLSARDKAGIGVRWPLLNAVIVTTDENVENAYSVFSDELKEQVNIKNIEIKKQLEDEKLNFSADRGLVGRTFKQDSREVLSLIEKMSEAELRQLAEHGSIKLGAFEINSDMVKISHELPKGWEAAEFQGGFAYISTESDEQCRREGFAREIARHIQELRKNAGMKKSDKASVSVSESVKSQVGEDLLDWICRRTRSSISVSSGIKEKPVTIKGEEFSIALNSI